MSRGHQSDGRGRASPAEVTAHADPTLEMRSGTAEQLGLGGAKGRTESKMSWEVRACVGRGLSKSEEAVFLFCE